MGVSLEDARSAKAKAKEMLSDVDSVVGIGITGTMDNYALKVNLKNALQRGKVPAAVNGVPVQVEVVGEITKQAGR
jgi:hypothetical protein